MGVFSGGLGIVGLGYFALGFFTAFVGDNSGVFSATVIPNPPLTKKAAVRPSIPIAYISSFRRNRAAATPNTGESSTYTI